MPKKFLKKIQIENFIKLKMGRSRKFYIKVNRKLKTELNSNTFRHFSGELLTIQTIKQYRHYKFFKI